MLAAAGSTGHDRARTSTTRSRPTRKQGFKQSTIQNVVLDQIREASPPMPKNLVKGQDARGRRRLRRRRRRHRGANAKPPSQLGNDGKAIFQANCASCHTLAAADATGTIGPNLDQLKPSEADRQASGRGRRRRHAGVQGQAHRRADRRGREVRLLLRRQVGARGGAARASRRRRRDRGGARAHLAGRLRARLRRGAARGRRPSSSGCRCGAQILDDAAQTALVAEDETGRIVGWSPSAPSRDADADGELWAIYVLPEAWGTGARHRR